MAYVKNPPWQDGIDGGTLITAATLNHIEDGIYNAAATADAASGGGGGTAAPDASPTVKGIVQLAGDLGGTATAPTVPGLAGKAATAHTHTAANITDFSEATGDLVGALLRPGANITLDYNDAANTLTISSTATGGGGGAATPGPDLSRVGEWWSCLGAKVPEYDGRVSIPTNGMSGAIWLPAGTYDSVLIKIETAGVAGSLLRFGAHKDDGTVLADFGTCPADTTGQKTVTGGGILTISETGWYYVYAVLQGVTTTVPTISGQQGIRGFGPGSSDMQYSPGAGQSLRWDPVPGALPATLTGRLLYSGTPWIELRRAS